MPFVTALLGICIGAVLAICYEKPRAGIVFLAGIALAILLGVTGFFGLLES